MPLVQYLPSVEDYECDVLTPEDPTGGAVEFTLTAEPGLGGSEDWAVGTWGPSVEGEERWRSTAITPSIGPGQDLDPTADTWHAWCRIGGAGGVIKRVGVLIVR